MMSQQHHPISLSYSYAHADEELRDELEKHLSILRRQGLISTWHDRQIVPGVNWSQEINTHFETAELILLLISPDFLASDYCYGVEMRQALDRHERGDAKVIPVILRPVDWQGAPFESLQGLPRDMKPVTLWKNRDEAFEDIVRGIRRTIAYIQGIAETKQSAVGWHEWSVPLASLSRRDLENRQYFLASLSNIYKSVLADSLQGTALITLGLQSRLDTIMPPARLLFRHLQQSGYILPPGTTIQSVYERVGGELLILGEPGSGKSTLLLHLAQSLCLRTQRDGRQPLPVIFNLSSWGQKRGSLAPWLVEELQVHYGVSRLLGRQWIASGQIFLLLDGLDEVAAGARSACIDAINAYRRDNQHLNPLVVCSRTEEYLAQQRRLMLQGAVVTQLLSNEQIDSYLASAGPLLIGVRDALRQDSTLRELASSPLVLHVLTLAYRDAPVSALPAGGPVEEVKRQIFACYIERMMSTEQAPALQQIRVPPRLPAPTISACLTWLARQMQHHDLSVFYLERLQPDWLRGVSFIGRYTLCAIRIPAILMGILLCFALNAILFDLDFPTGALYIHIGGLLGAILSRGSVTASSTPQGRQTRRFFWSALPGQVGWAVVIGVVLGLIYGHNGGPGYGILYGVSLGVASVLLQRVLRMSIPSIMAQPSNDALWQQSIRRTAVFNGTFATLIIGLSIGIVGGLVHGSGLTGGLMAGLVDGLNTGLKFGPLAGVLSVLLIGKTMEILPADRLVYSWASLRKSLVSRWYRDVTLWSFALIGLGYGIILAIVTGLAEVTIGESTSTGVVYGVSNGVSCGVSYALSLGLVYWLLLGLYQGISSESIEDQRRIVPNEGIQNSLRNGLAMGLAGLFIAGLLAFLSLVLIAALSTVLLYWLLPLSGISPSHTLGYDLGVRLQVALRTLWGNTVVVALSVGLLSGLLSGGWVYLRHYILRFLLAREEKMPRRMVPFLDEATRHILLRKAGGGYAFIHREFRDYIASLASVNERSKSPPFRPLKEQEG
jgi:TIR domain/NACHT domain